MKSINTYDKTSRVIFIAYPGYKDILCKDIGVNIINKVRFIECVFDDTISKVYELVNNNEVDVFITGGSNAELVKKHFPTQALVTIGVNDFDILYALIEASKLGDTAAFLVYGEYIKDLSDIQNVLNIQISQYVFTDKDNLYDIIHFIKDTGVTTVIGSSIVCDFCDKFGLNSIFIYSSHSIYKSLLTALEMQSSIQHEKEKSELLQTLINYTHSGVISVDHNVCIQTCNSAAENILNINKDDVIGKKINSVIQNTKLDEVIKTKQKHINEIQKINKDTTILTNRVPIIVNNKCVGAVATFHDIKDVQSAEHKIRKSLAKKNIHAKYTFNDIIGESQIINETKDLAKLYSLADETILIFGETGTGKELFAQSIHNYSCRKDKPFLAINCASLPENLLESELFGYEKGAFTGADKEGKTGLIELAHQGTLFLDEISEIPLRLQVYLLRFLQEREIIRIGGRNVIPINIRIISSSNKDLWQEVKKGNFRSDLYYRLNILHLTIPPLRTRKFDIKHLVKHLVELYDMNLYQQNKTIWDNIISEIEDESFPGNVRELENIVKRYCISLNNFKILSNQYSDSINNDIFSNHILSKINTIIKNSFENDNHNKFTILNQHNVLEALDKNNWNRKAAAKFLGCSRTTLWRKMKQFKLI